MTNTITSGLAKTGSLALGWDASKLSFYIKLAIFVDTMQKQIGVDPRGEYISLIDASVISGKLPYFERPEELDEVTFNECLAMIQYEDGLPCINGYPIWERLEGEPINFYKIFREYREMRYSWISGDMQMQRETHLGVNAPNGLAISAEEEDEANFVDNTTGTTMMGDGKNAVKRVRNNNPSLGTRSIANLAVATAINGRHLQLLARIYNWPQRVKAYDRFKQSQLAIERQRAAEMTEFRHAKAANDLLQKAMNYFEDNPNELNPKVALEMAELGMKYGRISVGLLGDKPGTNAQVAHQTNIAISNSTTSNTQEQTIAIGANSEGSQATQSSGLGDRGDVSLVDKTLKAKMKKPNELLSVLGILQSAGALAAAVNPVAERTDDDAETNVVDIYEADGLEIDDDGNVHEKGSFRPVLIVNSDEAPSGVIESFVHHNGGNGDG